MSHYEDEYEDDDYEFDEAPATKPVKEAEEKVKGGDGDDYMEDSYNDDGYEDDTKAEGSTLPKVRNKGGAADASEASGDSSGPKGARPPTPPGKPCRPRAPGHRSRRNEATRSKSRAMRRSSDASSSKQRKRDAKIEKIILLEQASHALSKAIATASVPFSRKSKQASKSHASTGRMLDIRPSDPSDVKLLSIAFAYQSMADDRNAARILALGTEFFPDDAVFAELLAMNRERSRRRAVQLRENRAEDHLRRTQRKRVQDQLGSQRWAHNLAAPDVLQGADGAEGGRVTARTVRSGAERDLSSTEGTASKRKANRAALTQVPAQVFESKVTPFQFDNYEQASVVVFVVGPPSSGKTSLCTQIEAQAKDRVFHRIGFEEVRFSHRTPPLTSDQFTTHTPETN